MADLKRIEGLTDFSVGAPGEETRVRFVLVENGDYRNILAEDPLPTLNILGLRRLAKHLMALADLLEYGRPQLPARIGPGTIRTVFRG